MFINTLSTVFNTTQQNDTNMSWPACMLPVMTAVTVTGIALGLWLYRRLKPIFYLPLPLRFFNVNNVDPEVLRMVFSYPIIAEVMRHADSRQDALSLSLINREAFQVRFFSPHLQSLHFKNAEQVNRLGSYCREVEQAGQAAGNNVLRHRFGQLAFIRTLSLELSGTLSVIQSLLLFQYLAGMTSLKIHVNEGAGPDSMDSLDSLFKVLQSLVPRHLTIAFSPYRIPSDRIVNLPDTLWKLTSLETLELRNLIDTDTLSDEIGQLHKLRMLQIKNVALRALPNTIKKLKKLETLKLTDLDNIEALPDGIGRLSALTSLKLSGLPYLAGLPDSLAQLKRLRHLDLSYLAGLGALPERIGALQSLKYFRLMGANLTGLPQSLWRLENLQELVLEEIPNLAAISDDIHGLNALISLCIGGTKIHRLPENLWQLPRLRELTLYSMRELREISAGGLKASQTLTSLRFLGLPLVNELPRELFYLPNLEELELAGMGLAELPEDIYHLGALKSLTLRCLPSLDKLPVGLEQLTHLQKLVLDTLSLTNIPEQIGQLQSLTSLKLLKLSKLHSLPDALSRLNNLAEVRIINIPGDLSVPETLKHRINTA